MLLQIVTLYSASKYTDLSVNSDLTTDINTEKWEIQYIIYGDLYKILKNTENVCKILKTADIYTERQKNNLEALIV